MAKDNIAIDDSVMLIDTRRQTFNMQGIDNRRFMFNPRTGTLVLGYQQPPKMNTIVSTHAEEHDASGTKEPFDDFIRGWVGVNKREYKHGVLHFAPPVSKKNVEMFDKAFDTLAMFGNSGANGGTIIRGFGKPWEQPLSNVLGCVGKAKPSVRAQPQTAQPKQEAKPKKDARQDMEL